MQNKPRAVFELPDGARFALMLDDEWQFDDGVPEDTRGLLGLMYRWVYVDHIAQDYTPYIKAIEDATGAAVVEVSVPSQPPPDAVF